MKRFGLFISTFILTITLGSCLDSDSSSTGSSNGSLAPNSIISYRLIQSVKVSGSDPGVSVVQQGDTVEYNFIDSSTIQGAGLNTLATTSWSYSASGKQATVRLNFSVGSSTELLTFTSKTGGTYRSESRLNSGNGGWHEGTFTISSIGGGTGGSDSGACNQSTGQITVYTSVSNGGAVSVFINGGGVGSLSDYYTSGSPSCGASNSGAITRTLTAGTHNVSASNSSVTWSPTNFNISACGCLLFKLQ